MYLSNNDRRALQSHEDAREREACGEEPDVSCCECEAALDEDKTYTLDGVTWCAACALSRAASIYGLPTVWATMGPKSRLEFLEVIGAAANELESQLRTAIRAGKAA